MTDFTDIKKGFVKYGKKVANKTSEYSKIAKLSMDIKFAESNIEKVQSEIGKYVLDKIAKNENTLQLDNDKIKEFIQKIDEHEVTIESKRNEIDELKKESNFEEEKNQ